MELIKRTKCPITNENELELLHSFKNFPVFMGCVNTPFSEDLKINMDWYIGKKNGIIQLNPLIPLEVLYDKSHGSGTIGKLWDQHHQEFAQFVSKYNLSNLIEIGAGHGKMIENYFATKPNSKWTVVEPNPKIKKDSRIKVIEGLFDETFNLEKDIDGIVHSHVIEHLYFPLDLFRDIYQKTNSEVIHLFSIPNLEVMLERNYTNALNFEHTLFLNETCIDFLLQKSGFEIIDKKYFLDDHSIFYATRKLQNPTSKKFESEYVKNKELYGGYISYHLNLIAEINKKISQTKGRVFLFGAHVFSQFLLNFGLQEDKIEAILDNDPKKQNLRLYGSNLKVYSPKILQNEDDVSIILRSGVYNNEIKEDIIKNINPDVKFWE